MRELIQLVKIQKDLHEGVEALVQEMETNPESPNLSTCFQIADRCMRLERDIALLTRQLLQFEQPYGVA